MNVRRLMFNCALLSNLFFSLVSPSSAQSEYFSTGRRGPHLNK